jgi:hypothetical protein
MIAPHEFARQHQLDMLTPLLTISTRTRNEGSPVTPAAGLRKGAEAGERVPIRRT